MLGTKFWHCLRCRFTVITSDGSFQQIEISYGGVSTFPKYICKHRSHLRNNVYCFDRHHELNLFAAVHTKSGMCVLGYFLNYLLSYSSVGFEFKTYIMWYTIRYKLSFPRTTGLVLKRVPLLLYDNRLGIVWLLTIVSIDARSQGLVYFEKTLLVFSFNSKIVSLFQIFVHEYGKQIFLFIVSFTRFENRKQIESKVIVSYIKVTTGNVFSD